METARSLSKKEEEKAVSSCTWLPSLQEDMLEADKASLALQSGRSEEEDKPLGLRDAAAATRAQQLVASSWFSALPLSSSLFSALALSSPEDMWEKEDRLRAAATRAQQLVVASSSLDSGMSA